VRFHWIGRRTVHNNADNVAQVHDSLALWASTHECSGELPCGLAIEV
jgi:hypothetical protein